MDLARPALREPETVLEHQDRGSTARRALRDLQQRDALQLLVGHDPLRRRVLGLQLLQALGVVDLHLAVLRTPTITCRSGALPTSGTWIPFLKIWSASRNLRTIRSGVCPRRFMSVLPWLIVQDR